MNLDGFNKYLVSKCEIPENWAVEIDRIFPRDVCGYHSIEIEQITIHYDGDKIEMPKRITFLDKLTYADGNITSNQLVELRGKSVEIISKKQVTALKFYKRDGQIKYSGSISDIIKDIFPEIENLNICISSEVEDFNQTPLFNLNSKIGWNSIISILFSNDSTVASNEKIKEVSDLLTDYGFNFIDSDFLKSYSFIFFPIPLIKIIGNKIVADQSKERLNIILERNIFRMNQISLDKISINCIIKNAKGEIIHNKKIESLGKENNMKYLFVDVIPEGEGEITWSEVTLFYNGTVLQKTSGYYIRDIKINFNTK